MNRPLAFRRYRPLILALLVAPLVLWTVPLHADDRAPAPTQPAASASARSATRAAFLRLIDRPRVDLQPEERDEPSAAKEDDGLTRVHFTFASEAGERVPGILIRKAGPLGRRPVVIVLHGTGGRKEQQAPYLRTLAARGFVAVAIDGRFHGERTKNAGTKDYQDAIARAFTDNADAGVERAAGKSHPFLYDTAWDVMRLIDYLASRPDVDAKRIGLIGFSKGGMETYLAAAADERVAACVPCIGVQSFRYALENDLWHSRVETFADALAASAKSAGVAEVDAAFVRRFYDRVVPGIYGEFDGPSMLPLIAPRPLLSINGDTDPRTPLPGVEQCAAAARAAYAEAGAADRFVLRVQPKTGHKVTPESMDAATEWFAKWLRVGE